MPIATHLLLDPKLPEAVRSYFRKRAAAGSPPFQCVEVPDNVERRQYLRDAAKTFGTGAVIAVANRQSDADYFEGAGIRISEVQQGGTGWILAEFPEAIPLPPVPPPTLWDHNGNPLIPDAKFKKRARSFGELGAIPSFHLGDWLTDKRRCVWLDDSAGRTTSEEGRQAAIALLEVARDNEINTTYIWMLGRRLFALGPRTDDAVAHIAQHHQLDEPTEALNVLRAAIATLNPWRRESWEPVREAVQSSCGLNLALVLDPGPHGGAAEFRKLMQLDAPPPEPRAMVLDSDLLARARVFLDDLASREVVSEHPEDAFLFLAMSEAPLRCERVLPRGVAHVIYVNLGAGRLVRLVARHFPAEKATALADSSHERHRVLTFEGGDVHVRIYHFYSDLLEGSSLVPRKRRAADD